MIDYIRVLFDEFHSETWSISFERAREMQPTNPHNCSYQNAARELRNMEFVVERGLTPLSEATLKSFDVLVLVDPCDPKWEATTSTNSPVLGATEIDGIVAFVRNGGGLLAISEYEHDKYGNNLNELLKRFGLRIENTTLGDPENCFKENRHWVLLHPDDKRNQHPLVRHVKTVCSFRGGTCGFEAPQDPSAAAFLMSAASASPASSPVAVACTFGEGRVVAIADSDLFGDEFFHLFDHRSLWTNIFYWLAEARVPRRLSSSPLPEATLDSVAPLLDATNNLRRLQLPDGRQDPAAPETQRRVAIKDVVTQLRNCAHLFPHQKAYLAAVQNDLEAWSNAPLAPPHFGRSLELISIDREHGRRYLVLFPMYLMNASADIRFDAFVMEIYWPPWLQEMERSRWPNPAFISGALCAHSAGYESECAVFFPEAVAGAVGVPTTFGVIFADREAARFQRYCMIGASICRLQAPPQFYSFISALPLVQGAFAFWDLIHDTTHNRGPLPRVLFKEKRRQPYWMYALEELRVDLASWLAAYDVYQTADLAMGLYCCYAIVFDRLFRFPLVGSRQKNYDSLAGQILTNALLTSGALVWADGVLSYDWRQMEATVKGLYASIVELEAAALSAPEKHDWKTAYELVARYVAPSEGTTFLRAPLSECVFDKERQNFRTVLDDEFPLSKFHVWLGREVGKVMNKGRPEHER